MWDQKQAAGAREPRRRRVTRLVVTDYLAVNSFMAAATLSASAAVNLPFSYAKFFFTSFFSYKRTVTSASLAILYSFGPAGLSSRRTTFFRFSFSASSFSWASALSSSVMRTTNAPTLVSLPEALCSSFLTKLVKPGGISRAKTAATGTLPSIQTWQAFLPACEPLMFRGWNGVTPSPGAGPDLISPASPGPANTPTTTAGIRYRFISEEPLVETHGLAG